MENLRFLLLVLGHRAVVVVAMLLGLIWLTLDSAHAQTNTAPICTLDISAALEQIFAIPATEVMSQAFLLGFSMPMTAYLVAYIVGVIVSMFDTD